MQPCQCRPNGCRLDLPVRWPGNCGPVACCLDIGGPCLQDLDATLRFFEVAKRVTLFLARVAPQHTIDTLVYEIQQQVRIMASLPGRCRAAWTFRMAAAIPTCCDLEVLRHRHWHLESSPNLEQDLLATVVAAVGHCPAGRCNCRAVPVAAAGCFPSSLSASTHWSTAGAGG